MRPSDIFLAMLVSVLWGGNFIAAKFGVMDIPPFLFTAIRFIAVAILLVPFVPRPNMDQLKRIAPLSLLATLHFSLLFVALAEGLDISTGAVAGQLGVPFSCLLGVLLFKDKIGIWRVSGIALSFVGIIVVAGTPNVLSHPHAFMLVMGSTFSWGIANIFVKRVQDVPAMSLLAWMSVCTVPTLLILSALFEYDSWHVLPDVRMESWIGLSYTIVASTIVAYGLWYYLLAKYTVSQVAPFSLPTPVFGIAFAQLFFTEELTARILIGGFLTIAGVAIIVIRKPKLGVIAEAS